MYCYVACVMRHVVCICCTDYEPSSMICMPVQVQREDHSAPKTIAVAVVFDKTLERGGK